MTHDVHEERELQRGKLISLRVPQHLAALIEQAAGKELISTSAFCRRAAISLRHRCV